MTKNQHRRFLRDGVLDEMIIRLRNFDKQNWTLDPMAIPTPAAIIELFEMNRMIIKDIEKYLESFKESEPDWYIRLLPLAHHLQEGLRNTFQGFEDEWEHFSNQSE